MIEFSRVTDTRVWPSIEAKVAEACARSGGMNTAGGIHLDLIQRRKQLWIGASPENGVELVGLTEIVTHTDGRKALVMTMCIGEGRERWLHCLEKVEAFGREQGCSMMRSFSRPGWRRDLAKQGYRHTHDLLEKDL